MILYQLANGNTVKIPEEQFFKMIDQDLKDLEGSTYGHQINDPFVDSVIHETPIYDLNEDLDSFDPLINITSYEEE